MGRVFIKGFQLCHKSAQFSVTSSPLSSLVDNIHKSTLSTTAIFNDFRVREHGREHRTLNFGLNSVLFFKLLNTSRRTIKKYLTVRLVESNPPSISIILLHKKFHHKKAKLKRTPITQKADVSAKKSFKMYRFP